MASVIDRLVDEKMAEVDKAMKREKLAREMTHLIPQSAGEAIVDTRERLGIVPPWYQTLSGERAGQGFTEALQMMADQRGDMQIGDTSINPIDFINPVAGIFGGKLAKTADLMALRDAMNRAAQGEDVRKVWQDTGWFQSPDGQWRFEIDDSGSAFMDRTIPNQYVAADDVMEHQQLYRAYPDAREVDVMSTPNDAGGAYGQNAIKLGTNYDQRSVMLHELQHAVQQREGFARGGSPEEVARLSRDAKLKMDDLRRQLGEMEGYAIRRAGLDPYQFTDETAAIRQQVQQTPEYQALAAEAERVGDEYIKLTPLDVVDPATAAYRRLAGEAEARAVQSRMNLTPEQRRMRFPLDDYDVPLAELIMRYGN